MTRESTGEETMFFWYFLEALKQIQRPWRRSIREKPRSWNEDPTADPHARSGTKHAKENETEIRQQETNEHWWNSMNMGVPQKFNTEQKRVSAFSVDTEAATGLTDGIHQTRRKAMPDECYIECVRDCSSARWISDLLAILKVGDPRLRDKRLWANQWWGRGKLGLFISKIPKGKTPTLSVYVVAILRHVWTVKCQTKHGRNNSTCHCYCWWCPVILLNSKYPFN